METKVQMTARYNPKAFTLLDRGVMIHISHGAAKSRSRTSVTEALGKCAFKGKFDVCRCGGAESSGAQSAVAVSHTDQPTRDDQLSVGIGEHDSRQLTLPHGDK